MGVRFYDECSEEKTGLPPLPEFGQVLMLVHPGQNITVAENGVEWYHGTPDDEYWLYGSLESRVKRIWVQEGDICFELEQEGSE